MYHRNIKKQNILGKHVLCIFVTIFTSLPTDLNDLTNISKWVIFSLRPRHFFFILKSDERGTQKCFYDQDQSEVLQHCWGNCLDGPVQGDRVSSVVMDIAHLMSPAPPACETSLLVKVSFVSLCEYYWSFSCIWWQHRREDLGMKRFNPER